LYSKICVIGLGTLGGFLAKNLSELETTKELLLFDYDTVEPENIKNSIYLKKDIGKLKTEAICDHIYNSNIQINKRAEKFIEGKTKIPKYDLIIDCRDFTYERKDLIDIRLFISGKSLIIDCRKNVNYEKQHEGRYIINLTKTEIKSASLNVTMLICTGVIKDLITNKSVQEFPIDLISDKAKKSLALKPQDLIFDENPISKKLINLTDNYPSIIDLNKQNDLTFCLGSKSSPYLTKTVEKNNLNTINDIMVHVSSLIKNLPQPFNYYVITINNNHIEILPETGSA